MVRGFEPVFTVRSAPLLRKRLCVLWFDEPIPPKRLRLGSDCIL
jgi:hypothetical protein